MNRKLPGSPIHFVTLRNWFCYGSAAGVFIVCLGSATGAIGQEIGANNLQPLMNQGAVEVTPGAVNSTALSTTVASERVDRPVLKPGSQGNSVSELQAALKLLGYHVGSVDGVYGSETANAVSRFQAAAGLETDGIVGPATWDRLFPAVPGSVVPQVGASLGTTTTAMPPVSVGATELPPAEPTGLAFPIPASASPATPAASYPPVTPAQPAAQTPSSAPTQSSVSPTKTIPPSSEVALPTLKRGMRGPAVIHLQERLRSLGLLSGTIDGVFGQETELAVKAAQRRSSMTPDGVVGPLTWSALLR
ncbi:MAG: peptidoglycan-binding protein [Scytolyngbya sp. HA4215-MV1]|jgi:peptidoglycan hydrolase-like protein with peptidoglycan-binding domain|nr:peptidoglycan-binding protein [Scytolyngbya sp. HA4215-MV1]